MWVSSNRLPTRHQCTQVGADPCNFLLINATLGTNATTGNSTGTLLLSVGGPATGALVQPAVSAADAPAAGPANSTWPMLGSIEVLGWRTNATSATLTEVPPPGPSAAPSRAWDVSPVQRGYLHLPLRALGLPLRCGSSYQLTWSE